AGAVEFNLRELAAGQAGAIGAEAQFVHGWIPITEVEHAAPGLAGTVGEINFRAARLISNSGIGTEREGIDRLIQSIRIQGAAIQSQSTAAGDGAGDRQLQ